MKRRKPMLVLLVGRDPRTEEVIVAAARAAGATCAGVGSPAEAEIALETVTAEAVVVDAGASGVEWLDRKAGDDPRLGERSVLVLSPEARAAARDDVARLGVRVLEKPLREGEAREALSAILPSDP
jgi:DNA-binding response OmpR family regulator